MKWYQVKSVKDIIRFCYDGNRINKGSVDSIHKISPSTIIKWYFLLYYTKNNTIKNKKLLTYLRKYVNNKRIPNTIKRDKYIFNNIKTYLINNKTYNSDYYKINKINFNKIGVINRYQFIKLKKLKVHCYANRDSMYINISSGYLRISNHYLKMSNSDYRCNGRTLQLGDTFVVAIADYNKVYRCPDLDYILNEFKSTL